MNENEKSKDFKLEELFPIIKHQGREFLCLPRKPKWRWRMERSIMSTHFTAAEPRWGLSLTR